MSGQYEVHSGYALKFDAGSTVIINAGPGVMYGYAQGDQAAGSLNVGDSLYLARDTWLRSAAGGRSYITLLTGLPPLSADQIAQLTSVVASTSLRTSGQNDGLGQGASRPGYQGNFTPGNSWFGNSSGTDTSQQYEIAQVWALPATDGIRLVVADSISETTSTNAAFTVRMGVRIAGAWYPAFFGGRRDLVMEKDATVRSDVIPVRLNRNDTFSVISFLTMSGGNRWPLHIGLKTGDGYEASGATDKTTSGTVTAWTSANPARGFGPIAVLSARPSARADVVAIYGDSLDSAFFDQVPDRGMWGIALGNQTATPLAPVIWLSKAGELAQQFITNSASWRRRAMADGATIAVGGHASNDIYNARTFAQIQADLTAEWALARSLGARRIMWRTVPPRTTSTDGWTTTGGQTKVGGDSVRLQVNAWLRGLAGGLIDICADVADACETARDSGIFKVPGVTGTGDTSSGTLTITNVANASSFHVNEFIVGAGIPASAIITNISGTTITYSAATGSTATATGVRIDAAYTGDGIHLSGTLHTLGSGKIDTTALLAA